MKKKNLCSLFLSLIMVFNMVAIFPLEVFAETVSKIYKYDGYSIDYSILNEWEGNQSIQVTIRNTGTESILNWALAYYAGGEVNGLWNAVSPKENIIKNTGYNYEIEPNSSVSFGYTLSGENLELPEKFEIISKRENVTESYDVQFDVYDDWGEGFQGAVTVTNTGSEPIEAWTLSFDTNFTIGDYWGGRIIESSENRYTIGSEMWTNPIMPNSSSSFGFTATKQADTEPAATNFVLTSVKIDENTMTEEAAITAEATYDSENNVVTVVWQSTVPTGIFEVMTSLDGVNFEVAATVENAAFYEYTIDSGFGVLYVKVHQNIDGNVVESNVVTVTENAEDIDYELDTDEDGLPDYYEDILGTDKNNADTDGDGLSDGYEVLYLGTDPLKADSDDNGINDGDEDFDNDGLTNAQECGLGTDPNTADTDGDGLNDGAEVNTHGTDPLKYDTDSDEISDGDEITLGLNPNSAATDGTPDSERTFTQTVSSDSEVLSAVNDDNETPFKVSLEMKSAGVAENNVYARESGYSNAIENSAIIGIAPEFVYTDGLTVEEVTVKFELDNSIVGNTLGTYAAGNDGFKGIKRLTIFMFFDDINMLLPVETNYDEVNNVVYTTTDRVGTYCLMDMEIFFQNLGIEPSKSAESEISEAVSLNSLDIDTVMSYNMNNGKNVNLNGTDFEYKNDFDVVFIIDEINYDDEQLAEICDKIRDTSKAIFNISNKEDNTSNTNEKSKNVTVSVYGMNGQGNNRCTKYGTAANIEMLDAMLVNVSHVEVAGDSLVEIQRQKAISKTIDYMTLSYIISNIGRCGKGDIIKSDMSYEEVADIANNDSDINFDREEYCFFFFDIYDTFCSEGSQSTLYDINNNDYNIKFSVVSDMDGVDENGEHKYSYLCRLYDETGGETFESTLNREVFVEKLLKYIYGKVPSTSGAYNAIVATGYHTVVLDKPITQKYIDNAYNSLKGGYEFDEEELEDCADTDGDGLWDFEEILFFTYDLQPSVITVNNDGTVQFPTIDDILHGGKIEGSSYLKQFPVPAYVENGIDKALEQYDSCYSEFLSYPVLPIRSDPTSKDGDFDGILDLYDGNALIDDKMPKEFVNYINERKIEFTDIICDSRKDIFVCKKSIINLGFSVEILPVFYYDEYGNEVEFDSETTSYAVQQGAFTNWYILGICSDDEVQYSFMFSENIESDVNSLNQPKFIKTIRKVFYENTVPYKVIIGSIKDNGIKVTAKNLADGLVSAFVEDFAVKTGKSFGQTVDTFNRYINYNPNGTFGDFNDFGYAFDLGYEEPSLKFENQLYQGYLNFEKEHYDVENEVYQASKSIFCQLNCVSDVATAFGGIKMMVDGASIFLVGGGSELVSGGTLSAVSIPVMTVGAIAVEQGAQVTVASVMTIAENINTASELNKGLSDSLKTGDLNLKKAVEERIKDYQKIKYNRKVKGTYSENEKHSNILKSELSKSGIKYPPYEFQAHHIVAVEAKEAEIARNIVTKYKIDIDSAANGVFLPSKDNGYVGETSLHIGGHSKKYYSTVNKALEDADTYITVNKLSGEDASNYICDILQDIREELLGGSLKINGE